jgi:hypothetical protein
VPVNAPQVDGLLVLTGPPESESSSGGVSERRRVGSSASRGAPSVVLPLSRATRSSPRRAFLRDFLNPSPLLGLGVAVTEARKARWTVNDKRNHRLWAPRGPACALSGRRSAPCWVPVGSVCPIGPTVIWARDLCFDQTNDGRMLEPLDVIKDYTRECLAIDVDRSIDAAGRHAASTDSPPSGEHRPFARSCLASYRFRSRSSNPSWCFSISGVAFSDSGGNRSTPNTEGA